MTRGDCESIRPLISAALDGELDEDDFVRLSEHLASCQDCRDTYQDYTRLRDELRTASAPTPPSHLTRSIREETVEKPPPPLVVRLASRAGLRFGVSTVAASLVILFALGIFGYMGYEQQTTPTVAGSQPVQEISTDWPVSKPIEIEFSKPMNRQSVEDNLVIRPTAERERLPLSWDGNTLIIGRSESHSVLLKPNTFYTVVILEQAEDRHGNPLGEFWMLKFRTSPQEIAVDTPPAKDRETEQEDPTVPPTQPEDDPEPDRETESEDDSANEAGAGDATGGAQADESEVNDSPPTPEPEDSSADTQQVPTRTPTAEEVEPTEPSQPTATATPEPTRTPKPPQPTATPEPEPEPEPTRKPTPVPTQPVTATEDATATPETIPVRGAFGEVYWGNESVEEQLGRPTQEAISFIGAEQEFQRGLMFRFHEEHNAIYVFVNGGGVHTFPNTFNPEQDEYPGEELEDGLYEPAGYFGKIWSENPDIAETLGNAISLNPTENVDAAIQQFAGGQMIYSRGMVYVYYDTGVWESYPARSGESGGYQEDEGSGGEEQTGDGTDQADQDSSDDTGPSGDDGADTGSDVDDGEQGVTEEETSESTPEDQSGEQQTGQEEEPATSGS